MTDEILPQSNQISTLFTYDTEYSADSVEWCPHDPHKNIFVCANYQLLKNDEINSTAEASASKRIGRILLFQISPKDNLKLLQTINTEAVLDQKWCPNKIGDNLILGVVNAGKKIEIYRLNSNSLQLNLIVFYELSDDDSETLILSLDWSSGKYSSNEPDVVASDSKGNVHRFKFAEDKLQLLQSFHGHEFEAWIAGFYYWDPNIFFSGGDDSIFLKYDLRIGTAPIGKNRSHQAGVTSLHSNKTSEHQIVTGSYDQYIRLWDIRNFKQSVNEIRMPGPLWRLKWDPFYQNNLLAACMLGGIHVVSEKTFKIVESYYEHENIAYGADWCHLSAEEICQFEFPGNVIIGTCSFYDHLLCVSKFVCNFE